VSKKYYLQGEEREKKTDEKTVCVSCGKKTAERIRSFVPRTKSDKK
jgi:hypothetical protein